MKRCFFVMSTMALFAVGLPAAWFEGTVVSVTQFPSSQPGVEVDTTGDGNANVGGTLSGTSENVKTMTAMALTALSVGQRIRVFSSGSNFTAMKLVK
ncbi:MAG: hypothetical protein CR967_01260 [Proteobacteria bacterium]|nr:MAG: hypothetical protein CR967_01260 [Pseudomonadota bacterium]